VDGKLKRDDVKNPNDVRLLLVPPPDAILTSSFISRAHPAARASTSPPRSARPRASPPLTGRTLHRLTVPVSGGDGSRQFKAKLDTTGTGKSFVADVVTITQNGNAVRASLPLISNHKYAHLFPHRPRPATARSRSR
jgi:hypothetical protein